MYLFFSDPPRDVTILSSSWSSVVVNWSSPFNETTIDFVDLYQITVLSAQEPVIIQTNKTFVHIDGLKQLTEYRLLVQAGNRLGLGPPLGRGKHFWTKGESDFRYENIFRKTVKETNHFHDSYKLSFKLA